MSRSPVTVARETAPDLHRLPYSAYTSGHPMRTIVIDVVYPLSVGDVVDIARFHPLHVGGYGQVS